MITLLFMIVVLAPAGAYYLDRTFTQPIENLLLGVEGMRKGEYKELTSFTGGDELSILAQSFNSMSKSIHDREMELRNSEERFRALADNTPNKLHIKDTEGRYILINRKSEELFGFSNEESVGKTSTDLFPFDKGNAFNLHDQTVVKTGTAVTVEEEFHMEDGVHTYLTVKFPIFGDDGSSIVAVGSSGFEITDRKKVEKSLRESEEQLRFVIDNVPMLIAYIGTDERYQFVNETCETWYATSQKEIIGKSIEDVHGSNMDIFKPHFEKVMLGQDVTVELTSVYPDGVTRDVLLTYLPKFNRLGQVDGFLSVGVDITKIKQTEAQLVQSSKLASLGEMATGIAHELNQPLNIIRMTAESLLDRAQDGGLPTDVLTGKLERIESQIDRAAAIINHMRTFGRVDSGKPEAVDLKEAVMGAVELVGEQMRLSEIELSINLPDTCRKVMGQQLQLEQVVLNLLSNASDAIKENEGNSDKPKKITINITDDLQSDEVIISIRDTGNGVPDKAMDRIFEPFFTTKEVGQGTGLGLSISFGIVAEMGGNIKVVNVDGGSEFTITLLATDETLKQSGHS